MIQPRLIEPAALEQVVPAVGDQVGADLAAPGEVDRKVGGPRAEAVQALVGEVAQAGEEPQAEEIEERQDDAPW